MRVRLGKRKSNLGETLKLLSVVETRGIEPLTS